MKNQQFFLKAFLLIITVLGSGQVFSQELIKNPELDKKVRAFLDNNRRDWRDMNVPAIDGQLIHDIIVKNRYTKALEIGTSTGHSGVWIAWALSKTGGKLITIDIDETRYNRALKNFEEAGLSDIIDARLANAHEMVPKLKGPFDFVFSDADKGWYKNYFLAVDPKLETGGCYTTHNVSKRGYRGGNTAYLTFLEGLSNYETTVNSEGGGVAISYKRAKK